VNLDVVVVYTVLAKKAKTQKHNNLNNTNY